MKLQQTCEWKKIAKICDIRKINQALFLRLYQLEIYKLVEIEKKDLEDK